MKTVVGMYETLRMARDVVEDLVRAGFGRENISLVAADQEEVYTPYVARDVDGNLVVDRETSVVEETPAGTEVAEGAGVGALIGGLGGLVLGLGALAIPGVGPIIAAGPILAAITGAGLGAVTGGMIGALVDLGVPDQQAHLYAEGLRRGLHMVAVQSPEDRVEEARLIMERAGLIDLEERSSRWRAAGWERFEPEAGPYVRPGG